MDYLRTISSEGDYLEFGVWKGRSFITAWYMANMIGLKSMHFYAFDSFKGLPRLTEEDKLHEEYEEGKYACSLEKFKEILTQNKVDQEKVTLVDGFYEDSLTPDLKKEIPLREAAIIMIDCDLYKSTKEALDFCVDYIQSGTVIIFEDWFCYRNNPNHGEQKAFNEWLEANPQFKASDFALEPTIKAFVIYRKD